MDLKIISMNLRMENVVQQAIIKEIACLYCEGTTEDIPMYIKAAIESVERQQCYCNLLEEVVGSDS